MQKTLQDVVLIHSERNKSNKMTVNALSPTKGVWSCSVVQRAAACKIQLVDVSSGSYQGDGALAVSISSSIVQRRSMRYNGGQLWYQVTPKQSSILSFSSSALLAHLPKLSLTSRSAALLNNKLRQSMFLSQRKRIGKSYIKIHG